MNCIVNNGKFSELSRRRLVVERNRVVLNRFIPDLVFVYIKKDNMLNEFRMLYYSKNFHSYMIFRQQDNSSMR